MRKPLVCNMLVFSRQALAQSVCVQLANKFLYDLPKMKASAGFHGF